MNLCLQCKVDNLESHFVHDVNRDKITMDQCFKHIIGQINKYLGI